MAAYVVFQENVFDQAAFEAYKAQSPSSIEKFGGRFLVRGGPMETLEGSFGFERVVIIEFPDGDAARAWHKSDDYAAAKALRQRISEGEAVLLEGV